MFSLIITIISIALVAALALATLYYGGSAFNKGSAEANASKIINEGQQINGAVQLFRADIANGTLTPATKNPDATVGGASDINLKDVVSAKYLQQLPASFSGEEAVLVDSTATGFKGLVKTAAVDGEVCKAVNTKAGIATTPADETAFVGLSKVFGCDAGNVVYYKF
jgi:hypothetical protein